jgi:hypothetical protein
VANVCFKIRTVNQNVIEENYNKIPQVMLENVIHECLKRSRCVRKTKRHYHVLKVTTEGSESRLVDVFRLHADLVVARPQVQLGKDMCTMQFIQKILYDGNRELIFNGLPI